jgi:hypothetical protein
MTIVKVGVPMSALMARSLDILKQSLDRGLVELQQAGALPGDRPLVGITQKQVIEVQQHTTRRLHESPAPQDYRIVSLCALVQKLWHLIGLAEAQGLDVLLEYLQGLVEKVQQRGGASKADERLISDPGVVDLLRTLLQTKREHPETLVHPKFFRLRHELVTQFRQNPASRVLVFTKLRNAVRALVARLNGVEGVRPARFVGQAGKSARDPGMSQKRQMETLARFKQNEINVLVSTNVAEEGLDIAECDLVIFYDTVASEIRLIQRRGRTARTQQGRVLILYCQGTSDETNLHIALRKVQAMHAQLGQMTEVPAAQAETGNLFQQRLIAETRSRVAVTAPSGATNEQSHSEVAKSPSIPLSGRLDAFLGLPSAGDNSKSTGACGAPAVCVKRTLAMRYGIRRLLGELGLSFDLCDEGADLEIRDQLAVVIVPIDEFAENNHTAAFVEGLEHLRARFEECVLVIDLLRFEETYAGQRTNLVQTARAFAQTHQLRVVPLGSDEEFRIVLGTIIRRVYERVVGGEPIL